jgi:transcriptional regulator with XRE-family HTH domain
VRERRGVTREALAFHAGLTGGSLARIELGQASPAWATVRSILDALDVTLADLATEIEAQEAGTDRSRSRSR